MHRNHLFHCLNNYQKLVVLDPFIGPGQIREFELQTLSKFNEFSKQHSDCLERSLKIGHITSSALITDPKFEKVLLTHHRKLNIWIQLGGHTDGEPNILKASLKEAREESGVNEFAYFDPLLSIEHQSRALETSTTDHPCPIDLDIHLIPAYGNEPAHYHYDIRFCLITSPDIPLVISSESKDLKWFTLEEAYALTQEVSMTRQFDKLQKFKTLQ